MKQQRLLRAAGGFFAGMLVFTVLARSADSINVIRVQTKVPQNQIISHEVNGSGKIEGTQEHAVFAQEDLQIEKVLVHVGQKVKEGDVLLQFTEESVKKAVKEKEDLVKTLELQIKDLDSQSNADQQKKASEQAWADIFYDIAAQGADVSVDNARQEVQEAQQRLDKFYEKKKEQQDLAESTPDNAENTAEEQNAESLDVIEDLFQAEETQTENAETECIDVEVTSTEEETETEIPDNGVYDFSDGSDTYSSQTLDKEDAETEQALKDALRARKEALNEAIAAGNQTMASAGKAVADANLPEGSDSAAENTERQLKEAKEELSQLTELEESRCEVEAPMDGVIKSLSVESGGLTSQMAVTVLYPSDGELRMTGSVTKDDLNYIEVGSPVTVTDHDGNEITGAEVESITEDDLDPESRMLTILLPEGDFSIGETVSFKISKDSGPYHCCVPLSAVYQENGKTYVYVTDTEDSVLGSVLTARKVEIQVKDRNQELAAVDSGSISNGQQVIIQANRALKDGCRIREAEE